MVFAKGISAQSWRITFILLCLIPSSLRAMFLEWWNRSKSLSSIWQHFSCLLDEGIPKLWKKLNSHGGFLRADQGRAKMCCPMSWIGCAILQVAQKAIVGIQFLSYFWNPLIKYKTWKTLPNPQHTFLGIWIL